jgi:hypothetical protein
MRYVLTVVMVSGCAGAGAEIEPGDSGPGTEDPTVDPCNGAEMEADLAIDPNLPDPAGWSLPPSAIVSTTYLQIEDTQEAQQAFGEAAGPIAAALEASPGLMGVSFASSESCGTQRTLSAWATTDDMLGFVTGPEHGAAISRIGVISRGRSITMSWTAADLAETSWPAVIAALETHDGPEY